MPILDNSINIFSSRDKIRENLIKYCSQYLNISEKDITPASYLAYLINVLSIEISNLLFYASSIYNEFFLLKARHRESVMAIAQMFGYNIEYATPARVRNLIMININDIFANGKIILNGLSYGIKNKTPLYISDENNNLFALEKDIVINTIVNDRQEFVSATIYSIDINGIIKNIPYFIINKNEKTYLSFFEYMIQVKEDVYYQKIPQLSPNEFYTITKDIGNEMLYNTFVYTTSDSIDTITKEGLYTNRQTWIQVPSIFLDDKSKHIYSIQHEKNKIKFLFGNGVVGKQPKPGDTLVIAIQTTNGKKGNIKKDSILLSTRVKYYQDDDIIGTIEVVFNNVERSYGGKDYPSINEIRQKTISYLKTSKRLVTKEDYYNIKNIIPELSTNSVIPIVKRTDLKCNEITIYTDLFFNNKIFPTITNAIVLRYNSGEIKRQIPRWSLVRGNEKAVFNNENIFDDDIYFFTFKKQYGIISSLYEESSKILYRTLFDMEINIEKNEVTYYYLNKNQSVVPIKIYNSYPAGSFIFNKVDYYVVNNEIILDFYITISDIRLLKDVTGEIKPILNISVKTKQGIELLCDFISLEVETLSGTNIPTALYRVSLGNIENYLEKIDCRITITSQEDENNPVTSIFRYYSGQWTVTIEVKKVLTDLLRSSCLKYESEPVNGKKYYYFIILDVPLTTDEAYDLLVRKEEVELFENFLLERFCNIKLSNYKMLTDDVSIKFVKSFGLLTNINKFNKSTKPYTIHVIDPDNISNIIKCLFDGFTVAITNFEKRKIWDLLYPNDNDESIELKNKIKKIVGDKSGFLMTYIEKDDMWLGPIWLDPGDILIYDPTKLPSDDNRLYPEIVSPIKLVFNGEKLVPLLYKIPLQISLKVICRENNYPEKYIIEMVKTHLMRKFSSKFGCDKDLYINEIEKAVEELWFIKNCRVIEPKYDIIFNYDLRNLSYTDLQTYTPELVYFTKNTINVYIVKD